MRVYRFELLKHEEYGTLGWKQIGKPAYDPLQGIGVAHDIMEHFPDDGGHVHEEMMALGAALVVRGQGGYWSGHVGPHEHLTADLTSSVVHRFLYGDGRLDRPRTTRRIHDCWAENEIQKTLSKTAIVLQREIGDVVPSVDIFAFVCHLDDWLRIGWSRARARYLPARRRGRGEADFAADFRTIEQLADGAIAESEGVHGSILEIRYEVVSGQIDPTIIPPEHHE